MAHRAPRPERPKKQHVKKLKDPTLSVPLGIIGVCIAVGIIIFFLATHG